MKIDLTQFNDVWASIPAAQSNASGLPDGTYPMRVEGIEESETQKGIPCLVWTLVVVGALYAGRKLWHRYLFDTTEGNREKLAKTLSFLKRDLALFGVHADSLGDLPKHFAAIQGKTVEVTLKTTTKGETKYQNSYLNKLVTAPAAAGAMGGNPAAEDTGLAKGISDLSPF